jgi:hypothetical protein
MSKLHDEDVICMHVEIHQHTTDIVRREVIAASYPRAPPFPAKKFYMVRALLCNVLK